MSDNGCDVAGARVAVNTCAEFAIPLQLLGVLPGGVLCFVVTVTRTIGDVSVEQERHPSRYPIALTAPSPAFDAEHWRA